MKRRSFVVAVLLALLVVGSIVPGAPRAAAQSGPEPGSSDPLANPSRYSLLRDDEVFSPGVPPETTWFWDYTYYTNPTLGLPRSVVNTRIPAILDASIDPQIWTTSGRITTPLYDEVMLVNRSSPGGWLALSFVDQTSGTLQLSYYVGGLADRVYSSDLLDLGAGDLDRVVDSDGNYHDEVVLAYATGSAGSGYQVKLSVLDYTETCQGGTSNIQPCALVSAQTSHGIDPLSGGSWLSGYQDNILGLAVGDFDGNGSDEIAMAHLQNQSTLWISTFRYTNDGKGNRTFREVAALNVGALANFGTIGGSITLEAGDFDGSSANTDELILGQVQYLTPPTSRTLVAGLASTVSLSAALAPTLEATSELFQYSVMPADGPVRLELEPGLFQFDPASGFDFGRRQFAAAWNNPLVGTLNVSGVSVNSSLGMSPMWGPITPDSSETDMRFSIAAGGYRGVEGSNDPVWGLSYTVNFPTPDSNGWYEHIGTIDPASGNGVTNISVENHGFFPNLRMELVSYDRDGDSVYLGTPVHYTVDNVINTDFVLQEPPKHAFYDNNPQSPTFGQVVTVSRRDTFNVQLQDSSSTTFSSKSTDTVDYDVGGSLAASASTTVEAGADIGIADVSGETTTTFAASASYDYKSNRSSYNSQYASRTVSFSGQTNRDDYLEGRAQIFDIWRYRIYGLASTLPDGSSTNGYYEVVLPGPVEKFAGGGLSFDWYQPLHENGNILSYPAQLGTQQPNVPDDLGVYTDTLGAVVQQPLVPASLQSFDGTSTSVALQYASTSGSGYISSYSHNLRTSVDISRSSKVTATVFGSGGTVQTSVKVGFNSSTSFGGSSTSDQTTGTSTGITLNKPAGNSNQAYSFSPVFYITQDGTVKAAHAASVLGNQSGSPYWASLYGGKADPALNLPGRFNAVLSPNTNQLIGWQPDLGTPTNSNSSRKQLRGFTLHDPSLNPITGDYDYLAYAPAAGDQVRVQANVYNYSTGVGVSNLLVQFQAIPYDADDDVETPLTSCPRNLTLTAQGRCVIGQTTLPALGTVGSGNVAPAAITWDTTGFGPSTSNPGGQYRIYVVLDPNNTIDEIYETEDPNQVYPYVDANGQSHTLKRGIDPGQNNEGYGYATIAAAATDFSALPPTTAFLNQQSLAALDARTLRPNSDNARVVQGQPARVRLTLYSDRNQREFNDVQIYDGDPSAGGVLIAHKTVYAGNPEGASVWFNWLPATAGQHTLYARVVKDHDDPQAGNGLDTLAVTVAPPLYRAYTPLLVDRSRIATAR